MLAHLVQHQCELLDHFPSVMSVVFVMSLKTVLLKNYVFFCAGPKTCICIAVGESIIKR
jgi:hypothetical protein